MGHVLLEVILNSILITGLVVIMMMMIECINVWSSGRLTVAFRGRGIGQLLFSAFLGAIPGCMGGFAVVSMYTHGLVSFGALIAMMIASSGDESFVLLAMLPDKAWRLFAILFLIAVIVGALVDLFHKAKPIDTRCKESFSIHAEEHGHPHVRHFGMKRCLLFGGVAIFITCLAAGMLEHEHDMPEIEAVSGSINLLSEDWMNIMFAALSLIVLVVLLFAGDHFVEEHIWHHIVIRHLPSIFAWTFGVLLIISIGLHFFDISQWINENTAIMILLAAAVGIIPESGPHMIFVTLYASGIVPLPVLLASCISQDGHASLPLIAESKRAFLNAKCVNFIAALIVGFGAMLI